MVEWSGGVYDDDDHGNGGRDVDANAEANADDDADPLSLSPVMSSHAISDRSRQCCLHIRSAITFVDAVFTNQHAISVWYRQCSLDRSSLHIIVISP